MTARFASCLTALALLTACVETTPACSGTLVRNEMDACVPAPGEDAGPGDAGGPDEDAFVPADAGPCDPACTGGEICAEVEAGMFECVECVGDGDCDGRRCSAFTCVDCVEHTHCDAATPLCVAGSCVPCTDGDTGQCAARDTATPLCAPDGMCVQCTAADESACTEGVCDLLARTCTTQGPGSAGPCAPCVNDRQCRAGQLCVPEMLVLGTGEDLGYACAWRRGATGVGAPNGACSSVRPYVATRTRRSLNDPTTDVEVCVLALSTCEAHRDFRATSCMAGVTLGSPAADPACGAADVDDGFCAQFDAAGANRCTVECASLDDCPCFGGTCASQYECDSGFCSLTRTCLVSTPTTCMP